jgi:hypothetical protein
MILYKYIYNEQIIEQGEQSERDQLWVTDDDTI